MDGTRFLSTPFNHVIALNARTGAQRWVYDPAFDRTRNYSEVTSRGVSAWRDAKATPGRPCALRIFAATLDARLIALDGDTGRPCRTSARTARSISRAASTSGISASTRSPRPRPSPATS